MNFIVYLFFRFFVILFSFLPFFIMYGISNFVAFLLYHVFGYRKKVVYANLKRVFPEKSDSEIKKIAKKFYINLSDLLVESIKSFSMSKKSIKKHIQVLNPEILDKHLNNGRGIIAVTGHIGNWEWGTLVSALSTTFTPVGFYKPLSNKYIDNYIKSNRGRTGAKLCSIVHTGLTFQKYKSNNGFFMMISDQNPSNVKKAIWVDFFGIKTACLQGAEKYAKTYDIPIFYFNIHRYKRGYYEIKMEIISENPTQESDGFITQQFMKNLENYIKSSPDSWLWSHKRWKHKFEDYHSKN